MVKASNHGAAAMIDDLEDTVQEAGPRGVRSLAERAKKALVDLQDETEKRMKELMNRGESYGKESFQTIQDRFAPAVRLSEKVLNRAKENAEWIQEKVEEAVNTALGKLHLPTPAELTKLITTVEELTKKVEALGQIADMRAATEEATDGVDELRTEVKGLRKSIDNVGKNLGLLEKRVRTLSTAPAKTAKPKTTKG